MASPFFTKGFHLRYLDILFGIIIVRHSIVFKGGLYIILIQSQRPRQVSFPQFYSRPPKRPLIP